MSGRSDSLAHDVRAAVDAARLEARLDRTHGGDVDAWARGAGIESGKVIDFSASINPLGPPSSARKAFINSFEKISRYPDPCGLALKEMLARHHGMKPGEVLVGNGSTQLIYLLCAALHPRTALVIGPAFSEYTHALALAGTDVRMLSLTEDSGFQFSTEKLMAAWDKDCDIAFFATPNSATGQLIPKTAIETIARAALTRKTFVVIDEAFIDFVEAESVKMLVRENPYVIVLRSLTKYFALPGLRLGYLLGETRRVAQFAACQEPWSVNAPALSVALACLKDTGFAVKTELWLEEERRFFLAGLASIEGLRPLPSRANFLLVKIAGNGIDALQLRSFLSRKKILIRACNSFLGLGGDYFRVAVKRRKDNLRLLAALREWTGPSSG
jgi:threonine-phosphate decarboxylase